MKTLATDPKWKDRREEFRELSKRNFEERKSKMSSTATATAAATTKGPAPPPATKQPLWSIPIEVLGLTGDFASGKTLFAATICPGPETRIYDTEKSAKPYGSLGFERIDIPGEMLKTHPKGYKPIDTFNYWWTDVKLIRPGRFRVIVLDAVSEIESGLVAYVRDNPTQFGFTAAQFARAQALLWGAVKDFWKAILTDLASRCETFAFTSHLKREFAGDRPTAAKTPKGKETLMELASLYLWLDRTADKKGNVPAAPSATVIKSRLSAMKVLENGLMDIRPALPPRIPIATPASIRFYLDNPPDYDKLKADERVRETEVTEAEIEALKLARAEAERDAAALQLERFKSASVAAQNRPAPASSQQSAPANVATTNGVNSHAANGINPAEGRMTQPPAMAPVVSMPAATTNAVVDLNHDGITQEQIVAIVELKTRLMALGLTDDQYKAALTKRGVASAKAFTREQADAFIVALRSKGGQMATATAAQQQPVPAAVGASPN